MKAQRASRIFIGVVTIPVAGVLAMIALLLRGPFILPLGNVPKWAETVSTNIYLPTQYAFIVAYVLPLFGLWAVYEHLAQNQSVERLAFVGMLTSVWGTALALPTLGIMAYINPIAGKAYASGVLEVSQLITDAIMGPSLGMGIVSALLYTIGPLCLGLAIWRSNKLPRWTGVAFALHGILLSFGFSMFPLLLVGWGLFTLSGLGIAWNMK